MKKYFLILSFLLFSKNQYAQDTTGRTTAKNISEVKSIWDIPHKTPWEKFMWIHRTVVYEITKDRPVNYDTTYIKSYSKKLVVTLPVNTRFLKFSLIDAQGKKLTFSPNIQYYLGVSVSSRWASFIINSIKLSDSDLKNKGKTSYKDIQLNLYGRSVTTDIFYQSYHGFYISNSKSYSPYSNTKTYSIRPDVNALNIEVNTYYIVNHKKFSYRNTFGFVEQQKKSAGSLLLGVYYSYFSANGSPSLVLDPFKSSIDSRSYINNGNTQNLGLNIGYIYTLVFLKKFYVTGSLVQGIGGEKVTYERDDKTISHQLIAGAGKLNVRVGLGYDQGKYFLGAMGIFDYFLFNGNLNSTFNYSSGKFMAYVGCRFSTIKKEKKILKRFKLIDYN